MKLKLISFLLFNLLFKEKEGQSHFFPLNTLQDTVKAISSNIKERINNFLKSVSYFIF